MEIESTSSDKEEGAKDEQQSGNYLILNLCHHFTDRRSITSLTLNKGYIWNQEEQGLMFELPSFFNSRLEPWIGKVVSQKAQKAQLNGMGWGHRFKVRIMGTYSENDNVEDKDCHTAVVMLGVTDGSGAANRMKSVKITQNDIVFGFFLSPDQNFPVITGIMGRTPAKKDCGGKFGVGSGHTDELKPGGYWKK